MAFVGYARVSSVGQCLEVQMEKLKHCDKIYQEHRSATGTRPRLAACLEYVREGDTLVVTRLDRLARSTLHLCQIAEDLRRKDVHLQVLDQQIHTNDATREIPCLKRAPPLQPASHVARLDQLHVLLLPDRLLWLWRHRRALHQAHGLPRGAGLPRQTMQQPRRLPNAPRMRV